MMERTNLFSLLTARLKAGLTPVDASTAGHRRVPARCGFPGGGDLRRRAAALVVLVLVSLTAYAQLPGAANRDVARILDGCIDFHVHPSPDAVERSIDDLELAALSERRNVRAVVIKNHLSSTAGRAQLVNERFSRVRLYGGITLNRAVGGINADAVETMCRISPEYGKVVWFPTLDADYHRKKFGVPGEGISILEKGKVSEAAMRVLEVIAANNLVLATGHLSPDEIAALVKAAKKMGISRILITHPLADSPGLTPPQMEALAAEGAVFELTFLSFLSGPSSALPFLQSSRHVSMKTMADVIRRFGAEHFILSSDLGQSGNPLPFDGMKLFVEMLLAEGLTADELTRMVKTNPARLLGLP